MEITCAWCNKDMGGKPPYEDKSVTHTICPDCKAKYFPDKADAPQSNSRQVKQPGNSLIPPELGTKG